MNITDDGYRVVTDHDTGISDMVWKFLVEGSRGNEYQVEIRVAGDDPQEGHCTCPGFKYRQSCKHVDACYHRIMERIIESS